MAISDLAKKFETLRAKKDDLNSRLKEVNQKISSIEKEMIDDLHQMGLERIDVKGIGSFTIYTRSFHKIIDDGAFMEHLRQNEDEDILSVNYNTLNAYVKDWKSKNEDKEVPGIQFTHQAKIRMRKG